MRPGRVSLFVVAVAFGALSAAAPAGAQAEPESAVAQMIKADGTAAGRVVLFRFGEDEAGGGFIVEARLSGLPPGFHGFHVHTTGSCEAPSFASAGGHLNPTGTTHGNHAGDMPLLYVNADGTATFGFLVDRFTLGQLFDTDGSAIVVHANPDNYANIPTDRYDPDPDPTTLATGDAGGRIACGVVARGGESLLDFGLPSARIDFKTADGRGAGFALLRQEGARVAVLAFLRGVPEGFHGFHVHATGSCEAPSFASAAGHLNPTGTTHGNHAGDMPVAYFTGEGVAIFLLHTDRYRVADLFDRDGSAVIVHANPDNYANIPTDRYNPDPDAITLATGDAGARLACGVVRRLVRCAVSVSPRTIRAGRRTVLRMSVRSDGRPVRDAAVRVRAPGLELGTSTGARGTARASIRPMRPGRLTVRVGRDDATLGCRGTARVLAARGTGLTGRAGWLG